MWKKIWFNIHWLLGLVAGTLLIVVGVTGAALSFEKEIMEFINPSSFRVAVLNQERLSPEELLAKLKELKPEAQISSMTLSSDLSASSSIAVQASESTGGGHGRNTISYYFNPYTGELLPEVQGKAFFRLMLDLHRRLMLGEVGKQIVGASTVALIILSFTGVYLYWGSIRKSLKSSLSINFKAKGRGFLYKLHSALGLWGLLLFLLMSLTGLTWSYEWYRASMYAIAGVEMPRRNMNQQSQGQEQAMSEQRQNRPEGLWQGRQDRGGAEQQNKPDMVVIQGGSQDRAIKGQKSVVPLPEEISHAWDLFHQSIKQTYGSVSLRIPTSGTRFEFSYIDEDAPHSRARNSLMLDTKSEKVLSHTRYDDKRINEQIMSSMLPLHSGEFFGWLGRILVFLASLGMLLFGITGLMLYLDRRKKALKKAVMRAQADEIRGN